MNQKKHTEDTLRQQIKAAFPGAFQARQMTHSECVQLRPRLIAISADGFEEALAQVLLDLVETHTGKAGNSDNAEEVVRFLDVEDDGSLADNLPDCARGDEMGLLLRKAKVESLADINHQQAMVLIDWLNAARNWPDLSWYRDEIASALNYWAKRVQQPRV